MLRNIAYETESLNVYGFIAYMSRKEESEEWIKLEIHARELLSMERNMENLDRTEAINTNGIFTSF